MKASVLLATHDKNRELPNVLYSLSRQKTSFPFEVVIVDDASDDPKLLHEIVNSFSLEHRLILLAKNVGCARSQSMCLEYASPDSDVIVLQSSDVLYAGDDVLEELCAKTYPGVVTMAEVRNVSVPPDLWRSWDENLPFYLENERLEETLYQINHDPQQPEKGKYKLAHTIFSGPRQPSPEIRWYFFLGAIRRDDLLKTCFPYDCLDTHVSADMHRLGMRVRYVDVVGLHQKHSIGG